MLRILGWLSLVVAIGACIALPIIHEPWVATKGGPDSIIGEEGLFEQFQGPWYFFAMAVMIFAARRSEGYKGFFAAAALGFFLLGWREIDLDTMMFRERWYNAPGKLFEDELSWAVRITLLAIFIVFAAIIWTVFTRCRANVGKWLADHRWAYPALLGVVGFGLLAMGVLTDKYRTVQDKLGIDLSGVPYKAYFEEVVELLGAIVLFIAAVELVAAPLKQTSTAGSSAPTTETGDA